MDKPCVSQLQDRIKTILGRYVQYSNSTAEETREGLHPYGKVNFAADRSEFLKTTQLLKKTLERFKHVGTLTSNPTKLLVALKDKAAAESSLERLKAAVTKCKSLIDEGKGRLTVFTSKEILSRLQAISKTYRLQYHEDDSAPPITTVFINTDMFYVEIEIESTGADIATVTKVTIAHTAEEIETPQVNQTLTSALRRGDFTALSKRLGELAAFYDVCDEDDSKQSLLGVWRAFRTDIKLICDTEQAAYTKNKSAVTPSERIRSGHGVLKGLSDDEQLIDLSYFVEPREVARVQCVLDSNRISGSDDQTRTVAMELTLRRAHTLTLNMERHTMVELCRGSTMMVDPTSNSLKSKSHAECEPIKLAASFVMELPHGMTASESLVQRIEKILGVDTLKRFRNATDSNTVTLDQLLTREVHDQSQQLTDQSYKQVKLGQTHKYSLALTKRHAGCTVYRIPFTSTSQILPCVQLLRQQTTFNTLFKSIITVRATDKDAEIRNSTTQNCLKPKPAALMFDVSTPLPFVLAISCRHPTAPTVFGVHVKVGRAGKLRVKKHLPMNLPSLGSVHLHTDSVLSDERLTQALESHMCIPTVMAMMYGGIDSHFSTLCVRKPEPPLPVSDSFLASLTGASMNTPATLGAVGTGGLGMNFDLAMPKSDAGAGLLLASSATTTAQATYPNLIGARMSGDLSLTPGMSLQPNLGNVLGMGDTIPSANSGSLAGGLIDPQAALVQLNEPEIDTTPIIAVGGIENKDSNTAGMEGAGIGAGTDAGTLARGSGLGTDSSVNGTGDVGRISDANGTLGDQNVKGTSHDHKLDTTTDILADSNRKRKREDDGDEHEGSDSKRQTTRPTPGV